MKRAHSDSGSEASEPKRRRGTPPNSPQEGGAAALLVRCNASASYQGMRVVLQKSENASVTREEMKMLKHMNLPVPSGINTSEPAPMLLSQSESNSQASDASFSSTRTASTVILITSDDESDADEAMPRVLHADDECVVELDAMEYMETTPNTNTQVEAVTHALPSAPEAIVLAQPVRTTPEAKPRILRAFNRSELRLNDALADAALAPPTTTTRDATGAELTAEMRAMYDAHEARQESFLFYTEDEVGHGPADTTYEVTRGLLKETRWGYAKYDAERRKHGALNLMRPDGPGVVEDSTLTGQRRRTRFLENTTVFEFDLDNINYDVRAAERESDYKVFRKEFDTVKKACKTGATTRSPTRAAKERAQEPDNVAKWRDQRAFMEAYQDAIGAQGHEAVVRRADRTDEHVAVWLATARENASLNEDNAEGVTARAERIKLDGWKRREIRDRDPQNRAKLRASTTAGQGEKKKKHGARK